MSEVLSGMAQKMRFAAACWMASPDWRTTASLGRFGAET